MLEVSAASQLWPSPIRKHSRLRSNYAKSSPRSPLELTSLSSPCYSRPTMMPLHKWSRMRWPRVNLGWLRRLGTLRDWNHLWRSSKPKEPMSYTSAWPYGTPKVQKKWDRPCFRLRVCDRCHPPGGGGHDKHGWVWLCWSPRRGRYWQLGSFCKGTASLNNSEFHFHYCKPELACQLSSIRQPES